MPLEDYKADMERCGRCSYCKWIPLAQSKSWRFSQVCPSIWENNFHSYSAGGRFATGLSLLEGRVDYSDTFLDIVYQCQMCGACDVSCKVCRHLEPLQSMLELRVKCVEDGQLLPQHMPIIDGLKKEDNMLLKEKADRGKWAEGLDVKDITKEKAEVLFHAGCRSCFDEDLWPAVRRAVELMRKASVDVGIAGKEEVCCGGRAYEMGYQGELIKYAEHNLELIKSAGVKTLVTSCADGYHAFKVLYHKAGRQLDVDVMHISEYLIELINNGKLKLTKDLPMTVTYHDPCHLGRMAEPWIPWEGVQKKVLNQLIIHEPRKEWRTGAGGIYETPREILASIPGLNLVEMERTREYAWCCGAGGGVKESYPEFALRTALERIEEAKATGAEAMVTTCPWCVANFNDAIEESGDTFKIYDIVELVQRAI